MSRITTSADAQEAIEALEEDLDAVETRLGVIEARLSKLESEVVEHEDVGWDM